MRRLWLTEKDIMNGVDEKRELPYVPFDAMFEVEDCEYELCHATGNEVHFEGDDALSWYYEYEDIYGNKHYSR